MSPNDRKASGEEEVICQTSEQKLGFIEQPCRSKAFVSPMQLVGPKHTKVSCGRISHLITGIFLTKNARAGT